MEGYEANRPPSKTAMRQILDAAAPDFRVRLVFAAAAGLRAGEFHALRWRHIDLDKGEVTVETRVDTCREEDVTKMAGGDSRHPDHPARPSPQSLPAMARTQPKGLGMKRQDRRTTAGAQSAKGRPEAATRAVVRIGTYVRAACVPSFSTESQAGSIRGATA